MNRMGKDIGLSLALAMILAGPIPFIHHGPVEGPLMNNEFRCSNCGHIYIRGWSEEEALEELKETFGPDVTTEECTIVCDDCYDELTGQMGVKE